MVLSARSSPPPPRAYHHGNLRQALVEAALQLATQNGPERVSVREAARLLGVSPAAPFRHFPNRRALMTAVAEEAGERLRMEVQKATVREKRHGLHRLHAIGRGYLKWAQHHPAHFRIASARDQIDIDASQPMRQSIRQVRELTEEQVRAAQARGEISAGIDARELALLARATVYGLARMQLDGHFPQWDVPAERIETQMAESLDLLLTLMGATASRVKMTSTSRGLKPGTRKT